MYILYCVWKISQFGSNHRIILSRVLVNIVTSVLIRTFCVFVRCSRLEKLRIQGPRIEASIAKDTERLFRRLSSMLDNLQDTASTGNTLLRTPYSVGRFPQSTVIENG